MRAGGRVIFVNRFFHPDQSATSQLLSDLSFGLSARGVEVFVVCSRLRYDDERAWLPKRDSVYGVQVQRVRTTRFGRGSLPGRALDYLSFYIATTWRLLWLVAAGDTLVAKTDPPLLSIPALLVARVKGARVVNWLQDLYPEVASELKANPLPQSLNRLLQKCRDWSLSRAQMNVVLGIRMRELLQRRGVPAEKLRIIENWAGALEQEPTGHSRLRTELPFAGDFIIGYSGNLGRAHEINTMLEAAALLRHEPKVKFLMVGAGSGMLELKQLAGERGLANFHFMPYVPREALADSLAAADVHLVSLLPALEGLIVPSKFYGILAASRPAIFIGDPHGELARIIEAADTGRVVAVGDAATLVRHVQELRADAALRRALGAKGRALYKERYTLPRALKDWGALLGSAALDGRVPLAAPRFHDLDVDEHFVGRTHAAEIVAGHTVENPQAYDVQVEEDDQRTPRHQVQHPLEHPAPLNGVAGEQRAQG
jgi:glycosyltransferase involved in cell wall biosynthesis